PIIPEMKCTSAAVYLGRPLSAAACAAGERWGGSGGGGPPAPCVEPAQAHAPRTSSTPLFMGPVPLLYVGSRGERGVSCRPPARRRKVRTLNCRVLER